MADQSAKQIPTRDQQSKGPHESDMKNATDQMAEHQKTFTQDVTGQRQG